jgi:hypothetical protein
MNYKQTANGSSESVTSKSQTWVSESSSSHITFPRYYRYHQCRSKASCNRRLKHHCQLRPQKTFRQIIINLVIMLPMQVSLPSAKDIMIVIKWKSATTRDPFYKQTVNESSESVSSKSQTWLHESLSSHITFVPVSLISSSSLKSIL